MRIIKIFLGSSIDEFRVERAVLGDYIRVINPLFAFDNIKVEILKCEDNHKGNTGQPQQDEIDKLLQNSDVSVFLFDTEAGEGTIHEFIVARELQQTKYHEILVFCHNLPKESRSKELNRFLRRLEIEKFYWKTYDNIEYIKNELTLCLLDYERRLLGKSIKTGANQEKSTKNDADSRFAKFQENESRQIQLKEKQEQLREYIHQDVENLVQEIYNVMENDDFTIAEKVLKAVELYEKACLRAVTTDYDREKCSDLLFNYARFLYKYGLYKKSEEIYLCQIPLVEELFGLESVKAALSYNSIGEVYWKQCDFGKALLYYFKALAIVEKVFGMEHPLTAILYNNIGALYWKQGDYIKALGCYFKALAIVEKDLGTEHPQTATLYNNIGSLYKDQCEYGKALEFYFKALAIKEKTLGTEHASTAATYNNIGAVYDDQRDYDKALEYYSKDCEILKVIFGTEHPDVAQTYNNIGMVYMHKGDYDNALEYYRKAMKLDEKLLGKDHIDTADDYINIGTLYYTQREYYKGLVYYEKAYSIFEEKLGPDNPRTQKTLASIEIVKKTM